MELERGSEIDRYVVESVIGCGGMAAVYKVRHTKLGTHYALKILTVRSTSIEERLLREGRVQAKLRHPNVVPVIDVVDVGDTPGLVMDYVEGPALDEFLDNRELSVEHAVSIAYGMVSGVQAAHREGFVHRDLKPANVMLEITEDGVVPKVADFGLAKMVSGDDGLTKTRSGMTMGTPSYMAPEQVRNAKGVDHRADIFAIGAILYEMFAGQQAFPGEDVLEVFVKLSNGERTPITDHCPDLPAPLVRAVEGSLAIDPEERIADCSVILGLLSEALGSEIDPRASIKFDADFMAQAREISQAGRSALNAVGASSITATETGSQSTLRPADNETITPPPPIQDEEDEEEQEEQEEQEETPPTPDKAAVSPQPTPAEALPPAPAHIAKRRAAAIGIGLVGFGAFLGIGSLGAGSLAVWYSGALSTAANDVPEVADDPQPDDVPPDDLQEEPSERPDGVANLDNSEDPDQAVDVDPAAAASDCSDPTQFEAAANNGELSGADRACLAKRMRNAALSQTDRDKVGRVMLRDASVRCDAGSCADYEREQVYFFEEVTRSDVDMMYVFATHMQAGGRHDETIMWANNTLERKSDWEPAEFVENVPKTLEMIARARYALFQAQNSPRRAKAAETAALEWATNLDSLGKDYTEALDICAAAAGSRESCSKRMYPERANVVVTLLSTPPGARIRIDGEELSGQTPQVVELSFGEHDIEMEAGGKTGKQTITVGTTEPSKWKWTHKDNSFEGQP